MAGVKELLDAIQIMIDKAIKRTTEVYFGIIQSVDTNNATCSVRLNGATHSLPYYGETPVVNQKYPVVVPQGNLSIAFVNSGGKYTVPPTTNVRYELTQSLSDPNTIIFTSTAGDYKSITIPKGIEVVDLSPID